MNGKELAKNVNTNFSNIAYADAFAAYVHVHIRDAEWDENYRGYLVQVDETELRELINSAQQNGIRVEVTRSSDEL